MRLSVGLIVGLAMLATACGEDGSATCVEVREPLDPFFTQHVLDPDTVTFLTDPPTSGPHLSGPAPSGYLEHGIVAAAQVRVLETGGAVVQYSSPTALDELRPVLETNGIPVVLAPADSLPAPIVATAWTWKLTCETPDVDRIREFIEKRAPDAPGLD